MLKAPSPLIPFGARSTAEDVLAGLDLRGRTILVTGVTSGIGLETMRALAGHGAHVIGLGRSEDALRAAAAGVAGRITPIVCDQADLAAVARAAAQVRALGLPLDAIVANAGMVGGRRLELVDGVEKMFLVNHVAHFLLIDRLLDRVSDGTGRIVVISSAASIAYAPPEGIAFDNLDGHRGYRGLRFYGQSKLANALSAVELSRRLAGRGVAVNAVHPGVIFSTGLLRRLSLASRLATFVARWFVKSAEQGAATQVLLAASPLVEGISGAYWSDCHIAAGNPHLEDRALAARLWTVTEEIIARAALA